MAKPPIQLEYLPKRRSSRNHFLWRAGFFLSASAVLLTCLVMGGCKPESGKKFEETTAAFKNSALSAWHCPGMTAIWVSENIVKCVKEER